MNKLNDDDNNKTSNTLRAFIRTLASSPLSPISSELMLILSVYIYLVS